MCEQIVRFVHVSSSFASDKFPSISRIAGFIDAKNFFKLQQSLGIESNPRQPKKSTVTAEIAETLEKKPAYFHLMSKGILLSATRCVELDRNRFKLSFEDSDFGKSGILDGGHNTFAIGRYMLSLVVDEPDLRKVKDWPSYRKAWADHSVELEKRLEGFSFFVPLEILFPSQESDESLREWGEAIRDITHARNNNLQLTDATKDNFQGLYKCLQDSLPDNIRKKVEWKTNDGGSIKSSDVVALALIALSKLPEVVTKSKGFNPVHIYSSKQACIEEFRRILLEKGNGEWSGSNYTLNSRPIQSALKLTGKILEVYDTLYVKFPDAYNANDGKFGRIEDVRIYDAEAELGDKKYSRKRFQSKYLDQPADYQYAEGYIIPLVVAIRELMKYDAASEELCWVTDPIAFVKENINYMLAQYGTVIRMAKYDPQKIGKDRGSYQLAETSVRMIQLEKKADSIR